MSLTNILKEARQRYIAITPHRMRIVDLFIACMVLSTILQILYVLVGTKNPYNSFLSGIFSSGGTATFARLCFLLFHSIIFSCIAKSDI